MDGPNWTWIVFLCTPVYLVHLVAIALTEALQSFSRSRLEELTEARGRPERAEEIDHLDVRTERAAESAAVVTGLLLATTAGVVLGRQGAIGSQASLTLLIALVGLGGYIAAGVVGRIFAESILDHLWPATAPLRAAALPFTAAGSALEWLVEWIVGNDEIGSRPASVEVEVPGDLEDDEDQEPEIPEQARDLIGNVVELTRTSASEIMQPRSAMVMLPSTVSDREAAEAFRQSGRSRIPLYGRDRDDVVGVLLVKDLLDHMVAAGPGETVVPAGIAREAYCVPESKNAFRLLEDMRFRRAPMAVVLDEYGGVAGLVTMEDLVEQLIGPIHDEHDVPSTEDPVVPLGDSAFEVDAGVEIEELNERFGVHLPTDEDYQTLGGLALHALGRLPEPGASFRRDGVEFTILAVGDRSIRRIKMNLEPAPETAPGS
ncbi:hemolysin family protein [Planctomyces sp. SH-PL62]|uniref:hemolysin family protein n=1 Tax=Planctomyces sp. SH-PL62 TaxID=1636152 RepID=UPI00078D4A84|nr:hemolysin family protein [Planctomyces sp. SH-PL62]AMV36712.1 Magnesium and cobalt efflux protein CorC [Planctomyces sp. SH-PL62]